MTVFSYDDETELLVVKNTQTAVYFNDAYQVYERLSGGGYLKKLNGNDLEDILVEIISAFKHRQSTEVTYEYNSRLLETISIHKDLFIRVNDKLRSLPEEAVYILN